MAPPSECSLKCTKYRPMNTAISEAKFGKNNWGERNLDGGAT